MAGVYKLEISESAAEVKTLLRQQKTTRSRELVQVLYLLNRHRHHQIHLACREEQP
jgi:hypothetical protein